MSMFEYFIVLTLLVTLMASYWTSVACRLAHLMRFAALGMIGCLLPGCCTSPVGEVPFFVWGSGVKYEVVERLSIKKMLLENGDDQRSAQSLIETLKRKFPNDTELMAYLKKVEANTDKLIQGHAELLRGIRAELEQEPGSALYYYKIPYPKGAVIEDTTESIEEGWLILYHGKVYKTYFLFKSAQYELYNGADGVQAYRYQRL